MSKYSDYMKQRKEKEIEFNQKMFDGLGFKEASNKYCQITKRVSDDESKIVLNVAPCQLFRTPYGFGLIVGHDKVVWIKNWQVFDIAEWYETHMTQGCRQVLLNKDYYKVNQSTKEFENIEVGVCESDSEFEKANGYHSWEDMVSMAKAQEQYIESNPIMFKAI